MTAANAAAAALDTNAALLALGNERFGAAGATFVRNRAVPAIRDANYVTKITASTPHEIDALLARAGVEFAGTPHRAFHTDYRTPPAIEARLALDGYETSAALVMLLDGPPALTPGRCQIVALDDDRAPNDALASLQADDWREVRERSARPERPEVGRQLLQSMLGKRPDVRWWIAYAGGAPAGYFSSWSGIDGVGQVEDLFVAPRFRHRGIATALVHHCVAQARMAGAGPVVIVADPDDTPKEIYARMGFRPVAIKRSWWRPA